MNRQRVFLVGVVCLLIGLQFRYVQSVTLTPQAAEFVRDQFGATPAVASAGPLSNSLLSAKNHAPANRVFNPPGWLGWSLLSLGSVFVLYSFVLKNPS